MSTNSVIKHSYVCPLIMLFVFISSFLLEARAEGIAIYVSPSGNDSWTGNSLKRPLASIQKARDFIRVMKRQKGLTKPITVYLRGGIYELSESIVFTIEDSGTESCPISYTAYPGEEPVITRKNPDKGPYLNPLIIFEGDVESRKFIEYLIISGITFSGAEPLSARDRFDSDNNFINSPVIVLKYTHQCIFRNNKIKSFNTPAIQMTGDGNKIIGNYISDMVGGAIYAGGDNFIIKNNVIRDIHYGEKEMPGWGIYLDSATKNTTIENNIMVRVGICLYLRGGNEDISIENNVFAEPDLSLIKLSNPDDHNHENIKVLRNIFYYRKTDIDIFNISGQGSLPSVSDYNIFWNPVSCIWLNPVIWGIRQVSYFPEWQALGFDVHSIVKDPMFVDIVNDDYSLKPISPAFKMGFNSIDSPHLGSSIKRHK